MGIPVAAGKIVGVYGLVGAGCTELAKCVMGLYPLTGGRILVDGRPAQIRFVADAIHRYGVGCVSEDRKQEGLILMHSVLDNAGITVWPRLARRGRLLADATIGSKVGPLVRRLEVRTPSLDLSGGNQQKVSVAKWLAAPDAGAAVLFITSDMPEMIALADRIVVRNDYWLGGDIANTRECAAMSQAIMAFIRCDDAA